MNAIELRLRQGERQRGRDRETKNQMLHEELHNRCVSASPESVRQEGTPVSVQSRSHAWLYTAIQWREVKLQLPHTPSILSRALSTHKFIRNTKTSRKKDEGYQTGHKNTQTQHVLNPDN